MLLDMTYGKIRNRTLQNRGGNKLHVFFCRFRVPAPVVFVDGVLDREAFAGAFSSFWTSSIARFCRVSV